IICIRFEAMVALGAGVDADWQGHRVDQLNRIGGLFTDDGQPLLNHCFHLPEVGCLASKEGALPELWEEMGVMTTEIVVNGFILVKAKILTADLKRNHFFIG